MPENILHIDSSILGAQSVSRKLSREIVDKLLVRHPSAHVVYRDLDAQPLAHLTSAQIHAFQTGSPHGDADIQADLSLGAADLEAFLAADTVVIGVGFYNLGVASHLKAWIDRISVPGKTFRYSDSGPVGLVNGKRIILAIARGGRYEAGTPAAALEHAETHLRSGFALMGVTEVQAIAADGVALGPDARLASIAAAEERIAELT